MIQLSESHEIYLLMKNRKIPQAYDRIDRLNSNKYDIYYNVLKHRLTDRARTKFALEELINKERIKYFKEYLILKDKGDPKCLDVYKDCIDVVDDIHPQGLRILCILGIMSDLLGNRLAGSIPFSLEETKLPSKSIFNLITNRFKENIEKNKYISAYSHLH